MSLTCSNVSFVTNAIHIQHNMCVLLKGSVSVLWFTFQGYVASGGRMTVERKFADESEGSGCGTIGICLEGLRKTTKNLSFRTVCFRPRFEPSTNMFSVVPDINIKINYIFMQNYEERVWKIWWFPLVYVNILGMYSYSEFWHTSLVSSISLMEALWNSISTFRATNDINRFETELFCHEKLGWAAISVERKHFDVSAVVQDADLLFPNTETRKYAWKCRSPNKSGVQNIQKL
jgi:hypothetical protein